MEKKIIFSIIAVIIILIIVFLSQRVYSGKFGQNLISDAKNQTGAYLTKGANWAISTIYPKIAGEVQNRGEAIKNEISSGEQKISDTKKNIENYFSGIKYSILNPSANNTCPTPAPTDK